MDRLDRKTKSQTEEASVDAIVIAGAILDLASAVREHTRALVGDEQEEDEQHQYDLAGE